MKINTNVMIGLDATMITFLTWIVLLVPAFSEVCPGQFDCEAFNRISCIDYIKVCDSNWDCYGKTDENYCYAPIVSVPATHSSVTTGNSVTVNCTVFSKLIVTDVYWQRTIGGVISLIKSTTNTNKYSGITANTPSLTIYNADTSDVGTYRCFAANVFGYGNSYPIELFLTEHANITITEFTTEGELVTGRNVTVICRAYVMHKKGPISVVWKMNNSVINPTHSSRWIPEIIQSNHPERWLFRLTVIKMKTSDSGILTCGVSDGLVNAEETLILNVIGKPTVDISPRTLTATLGDIVNINCTVVDSFSVNTSILWYKNGNIFNGNQDESVIRTDQAHTKLVVHGIQNSAQYACSGIDNYGEGDRITSHVTVINPDNVYQYCPINVDQFGGVWGITIENTIAIIPCPGDRTGTTSRLCNGNGDWEEPNYSACISLDLFILNLQSDFLKNGVEVKDSNSILLDLKNLTEPDIRENLTSGELEISSEILDNTAYYAKERTDSLSVDQLEIFVSSCDNLLKENTIPSWEQLKQLNFKGATRIAKAVTVYTKAYTNLNDSAFQRTVQKDQLVVQVGKVFNEDITFPKKTQELPYWITESTNQVTLSKDNFEGEKPVGYSTTYYRNISTLFHQYYLSEGVATKMNGIYDVNSVVIDFSIEPTPNRLQHPLVVKFEHLRVNYSNPVCAFWDFDALNTPNGAWSFSGSKLFKTSDGVTVCQYDHTSNFALLMSPGKATSSHSLVLSKISAAGCIISSIFLVVTVIVHALLWRHLTRDTHGRKLKRDKAMLLVNLCIALTISYVLFVVGITRTDNKKVCTSMAVLLHYIFLVDFACMLAVGIELAIYVLFVFSTSSRTKWLVPACWVFPAVIVGISVSATKLDGYGNSQYCWLSIESKLIWTFVGPALTVILINFIILMIVMKTTCVANPMQTKKDKTNIQRTKAGIRNLCVIVPLFGVTWVLGVFSVNDETVVFQYLFAIFNSLQGFFIFVFHTVLDKHVREGIQNMREKKADKSSVYSQKDETKESYVHSTEFDDISKPKTHATGPVNSMANNEYSYQKKTERDNNKETRYSTNPKDILGSIKQYNTKKTKV